MIFPDTSPRDVPDAFPEGYAHSDWKQGYSAGHYCDTTKAPFNKHFKMYTYITQELPRLIEAYFPVDPTRKSLTGHSMGGGGALMIAARNPGMYRSVSAFAPVFSTSTTLAKEAFELYFNEKQEGEMYDFSKVIKREGAGATFPDCLIDIGTSDHSLDTLDPNGFRQAIGEDKDLSTKVELRLQEGYDHGYYFVQTFFGDHV